MKRTQNEESCDNEEFTAHRAAARGDLTTLTEAIKQDPSLLEIQNAEGATPLIKAVNAKQLETVKLLVKMGSSMNTQDAQGRTSLSVAAYQGWYEGVIYLLRSGAKQIPDRNGRLPIHAATYDTDAKTLSALLQTTNYDTINEQDNEGMTALHWAAFHNRPEHVQLLILKGSELLVGDIDGKTSLHWAAQNGSIQCAQILTNSAANSSSLINVNDSSGKTAVHLAAAAGHHNLLKEFSNLPVVDFEAVDPDERTPLHWAAATGRVKCVQTLLKLQANPNAKDCLGGTPLDYAAQSGHTEAARLLQQCGAQHGSMRPESTQGPPGSSGKGRHGEGGDGMAATKKSRFGFLSNLFSKKSKDKSAASRGGGFSKSQSSDFASGSKRSGGSGSSSSSGVQKKGGVDRRSSVPTDGGKQPSRSKNHKQNSDADLTPLGSPRGTELKPLSLQKYSPLPSPVMARRREPGDSAPDNPAVTSPSDLRPVSRGSAMGLEVSAQEILAAQRSDPELNTIAMKQLPATQQVLAPIKGKKPDAPQAESQAASFDLYTDSSIGGHGMPNHNRMLEPLQIVEKPHKKKKKKHKHKRAIKDEDDPEIMKNGSSSNSSPQKDWSNRGEATGALPTPYKEQTAPIESSAI